MFKVFIDGQVGTTGLQIVQRLQLAEDIQLVEIPIEHRKDTDIKRDYLNESDAVILCLPDEAAREAVGLISNPVVRVLDASTAHRTNHRWTYGLPELVGDQREKIKNSRYVSVPGCYPTGFILAVAPLVRAGFIPVNYPVSIQAVSGYSGGGRKLIEQYKSREADGDFTKIWPYRPYSLNLNHKHIPEMQKYANLEQKPLFVPSVGHFHQGMLVMVPLHRSLMAKESSPEHIVELYRSNYDQERFIRVFPANSMDALHDGYLSPIECIGTNQLDLLVFGNKEQILLVARLDNLGKGASGAAVQNLNLMLGIAEDKGLV